MTTFTELVQTGIVKEGDILVSKEGLSRPPFNRWGGRAYLCVTASEGATDYDDLRIRPLRPGRLGEVALVKKTEDLWDGLATLRVANLLSLYR